MKKKNYCVMLSVEDHYFGSKIIRAKNEVECMNRFVDFMVKNDLSFNTDVDIEIEEID